MIVFNVRGVFKMNFKFSFRPSDPAMRLMHFYERHFAT